VIELSWKSSRIEGNTYSLLETESLILQHEEAIGHKKEEATMILNHKKALDYVRAEAEFFKTLSIPKIEDIHSLLIGGLGVTKGLRKSGVGIVGTKYRPLDNLHQIREAMEKMCVAINGEPDPFAKSLLASVLIAYIQPFADGNKRTSRIIGNALLMAYGACPLSYRSANETEYKKAVILFYEQGNMRYYKELFIQQFAFAVGNYFLP
jgi:Fic family protein